jgi:mannitol 2-dehydrogenase
VTASTTTSATDPAYKTSLLRRLANAQMADQLSWLCRRGSTKMPSYLLPSSARPSMPAGRAR